MSVHTCRHSGEVFPSYPDLRQHLDSHLLPHIGHMCTTCPFTRREYLIKNSARCTPQTYVCNVGCHSSFGRRRDLATHDRPIRCGDPRNRSPRQYEGKQSNIFMKTLRLHQLLYHWPTSFLSDYKKSFAITGQVYAHMWLEDPCRQGSTNG